MNLQTDDLIEDALRTYPLADVPPNFSKSIMRRIDKEKAKASPPSLRFRLTWMDYALGFFLTLLPTVGFVIWASLPRLAVLHLEFQWQVLQASGLLPVLTVSLAAAGVLLLSGFLVSLNLFLRPGRSLT
jgi:hypothetical protein